MISPNAVGRQRSRIDVRHRVYKTRRTKRALRAWRVRTSSDVIVLSSLQEECSRNSQSALNSKDKSKASSVGRIEHRALVHHSAAAASGSPDAVVAETVVELPERQADGETGARWTRTRAREIGDGRGRSAANRACRAGERYDFARRRRTRIRNPRTASIWLTRNDAFCNAISRHVL